MNKIIVNIAIASSIALGATFAHAADASKSGAKNYNYYEMYDPHGSVQTHKGSKAEGVIHSQHPINAENVPGVIDANAPIPPTQEMTHPGHSKVDGA